MKKQILPILLLILPYLYLITFGWTIGDKKIANHTLLLFFIIWVILFVAFFISAIIVVVLGVFHGVKSQFLLRWDMVLKCCNIPIYLLIFCIGFLFVSLPGAVIFTPFLMVFDYTLLVLTSILGIGGLVQARRKKEITLTAALVLGLLHFVFCADVICAVVAFCKVKSQGKNSAIHAAGTSNENH